MPVGEAWTEDGRWVEYLEDGTVQEITEESRLLAKLESVIEVKGDYLQEAHKTSNSRKKDLLEGVADKDRQIAWIESKLPYALYSEEEVKGLLGEAETAIEGIQVRYLETISKWAVWEPQFLNPGFLVPHPHNSLIYGAREDVSDLVELISHSGWMKPIVITRYRRIISGHRRWLAALELKKHEVPVEIRTFGSEDLELEILLLENVAREKTMEQRIREAEIYRNIPGWLKKQREAQLKKSAVQNFAPNRRTRDILGEKVGISGYSYSKARQVCQAIALFEQDGGETEVTLAGQLRTLLNEKSIDAAFKQLEAIEKAQGSRYVYIGEESVVGYLGTETGHLLPGTVVVVAWDSIPANPQAVTVRLPGVQSNFVVPRRDLELTEVGKGRNGDGEERRRGGTETSHQLCPPVPQSPSLPVPQSSAFRFTPGDKVVKRSQPELVGQILTWHQTTAGWWIRWEDNQQWAVPEADLEVPPLFAVGDDVERLSCKVFGVVKKVEWDEIEWWYKFVPREGKTEYVPESDLALQHKLNLEVAQGLQVDSSLANSFKVGQWWSNGRSVGRVIEVAEKRIVIQWMGMGEGVAPSGEKEIFLFFSQTDAKNLKELVPFRFDPASVPAHVLRFVKSGDVVYPAWEKNKPNKQLGTIQGVNGNYWDIAWFDTEKGVSQLKDGQLAIFQLCDQPFCVGDKVLVKQGANLPLAASELRGKQGQIIALYRTVADVIFEGKPMRLLYEWLELAVQKSFLDCQSPEAVIELLEQFKSDQLIQSVVELWKAWKEA